jgi:hypothetical protein
MMRLPRLSVLSESSLVEPKPSPGGFNRSSEPVCTAGARYWPDADDFVS